MKILEGIDGIDMDEHKVEDQIDGIYSKNHIREPWKRSDGQKRKSTVKTSFFFIRKIKGDGIITTIDGQGRA